MKILHISTYDSGGAGLAALFLHKSLLSRNIDSKMLVLQKRCNLDSVFIAKPSNLYEFIPSRCRLYRHFQSIMRNRGKMLTKLERFRRQYDSIQRTHKTFFTFPISQYDLAEHTLVKEADIIVLHWVADFIDFNTFFMKVDKPILWILRDENPGLGGFHYESSKKEYYNYYKSIEDEFYAIKMNAISRCNNLTLVAMTDYMKQFCEKHEVLSKFPLKKIFNIVDTDNFIIKNRKLSKLIFDYKEDDYLISFCSVCLNDKRKGLDLLISALDKIGDNRIKLICIGYDNYFKEETPNILCLGNIENKLLMSVVYSASNLFVSPSIQESFGKTYVEAMSCGTPVVAFPTGIVPELINETNGVVCSNFTIDSLVEGIQKAMSQTYNPEIIRQSVKEKFSPAKIAGDYIDLYKEILNK